EAMVDLVYQGAAEPMYYSVYQVLDFWVNNDAPRYDYDPEKAVELLEELGFDRKNEEGWLIDGDGNELNFRLATNADNPPRVEIIQIFADAAREVGVHVETDQGDFNTLVGELTTVGDDRNFDAILIGLTGGSRDWPFGVNVVPHGTGLHMYNQSEEYVTPEE